MIRNLSLSLLVFTTFISMILVTLSFDVDAARRAVARNGPSARGAISPKPTPVAKSRHKTVHKKKGKSRRRTVAAITLTSAAFRSRNCRAVTIISAGVTYYQSCGIWYHRGYQSGSVVYIQSSAPVGY